MNKRLTKAGSVLAAIVLLVVAAAGTAAAVEAPELVVSPGKAAPGQTVSVSGAGCAGADSEATVAIGTWKPVTVKTDVAEGTWTAEVVVPADANPATLAVKATCDRYTDGFGYKDASVEVVKGAVAVVTLDQSTVAVGGTLNVAAGGFGAEEDLSVTLFSDPVELGSLKTDAGGTASGAFTIPDSVDPGSHRVEVKGLTSGLVASAEITVTAAAVPVSNETPAPTGTDENTAAPAGDLARTGSSALLLTGAGLALTILGGAFLVARRRSIA